MENNFLYCVGPELVCLVDDVILHFNYNLLDNTCTFKKVLGLMENS